MLFKLSTLSGRYIESIEAQTNAHLSPFVVETKQKTPKQQDGNGVIENEELKGFMKDLMDFLGKVSSVS